MVTRSSLPTVRVMENGNVFGGVVVVAGLKAERHVVALVEPEHEIWSPADRGGTWRERLTEGYQKVRAAQPK